MDVGPFQSTIPMLKLTKKSDYALIALVHLAAEPRRQGATAKEIAESYRIPLPLLSKVLQTLCKTGYLASEQGTKGGYRLGRDPRMISALEVVRAIDGPVFLASCFHGDAECEQLDTCIVKEPLRKVHEGILRLLDNISISDLTADSRPMPMRGQSVWPVQLTV